MAPMTRSESGASTRSGRAWPLLVVVGGVLIGLVWATAGSSTWRYGCIVIGLSLCLGGVERLLLPNNEAGLLQVRGRTFDVIAMTVTGLAVIGLAILVPSGR